MKFIVVTLGLLAGAMAFGQDLFGNDKEAFVLMPAKTIASGVVRQVELSNSGRFVFYRQVSSTNLDEILDYDSPEKGKWFMYDRVAMSTTALKFPIPISNLTVLGDEKTIYFQGNGDGAVEGFYNIATGKSTAIHTSSGGRTIYGGEKAYAPFFVGTSDKETMVILRLDGSTTNVKIDQTITISFLISGDSIMLNFYAASGKKPNRKEYVATLNLAQLDVTYRQVTRDEWAKYQLPEDVHRSDFMNVKSGDMEFIKIIDRVQTVTTQPGTAAKPSEKPTKAPEYTVVPKMARIGPAGGILAFSPRSDFVIYQDAGSLLIREIQPIDPDAARKLAMTELKKKLLNKVKQVGLGFLIYATDADDNLPGQEGWEAKLGPYMKDKNLMKDFNYLLKGGNLNSFEDPASTELGFIVGPGGRAVVYIDGRAKWIKDP